MNDLRKQGETEINVLLPLQMFCGHWGVAQTIFFIRKVAFVGLNL